MTLPVWGLNEEMTSAKYNQYIQARPEFGIYWQSVGQLLTTTVIGLNFNYNFYMGPMLGDHIFFEMQLDPTTSAKARILLEDSGGTTLVFFWESLAVTSPQKVSVVSDITQPGLARPDGSTLLRDLRGLTLKATLQVDNAGPGSTDSQGHVVGWGISPDILKYGDQF